jgi:hypothetical protein
LLRAASLAPQRVSVPPDMAFKHPAKNAMDTGFHRKCNFCTSAGLFTRRLKLRLADRAGNHTGLICHLHGWVLLAAATVLAAAIRANKHHGCWSRLRRRSGHRSAQSLARSKLAHRQAVKPYSVINLKQRVH